MNSKEFLYTLHSGSPNFSILPHLLSLSFFPLISLYPPIPLCLYMCVYVFLNQLVCFSVIILKASTLFYITII